mgnify:CR=1 FL=1
MTDEIRLKTNRKDNMTICLAFGDDTFTSHVSGLGKGFPYQLAEAFDRVIDAVVPYDRWKSQVVSHLITLISETCKTNGKGFNQGLVDAADKTLIE